MGTNHTSNSVTGEQGYVLLAQGHVFGTASPEDTEDITVMKLPLAEAVSMVERGEITDSLSMAGLLLAARRFGI